MKKFEEITKFKTKRNKELCNFSIRMFMTILLLIFVLLQITVISYAHSGRTDSNGGHYDRSTGEYHYHHGYSAHQHENGVCPYELSNTTSQDNSSYKSQTTTTKSSSKTPTKNLTNTSNNSEKSSNGSIKSVVSIIIGCTMFAITPLFAIISLIREKCNKTSKVSNEKKLKTNSNLFINKIDSKLQSKTQKYICPKCGGKLIIKSGKYGHFIGCSNYPYCKYTKNYKKNKFNW